MSKTIYEREIELEKLSYENFLLDIISGRYSRLIESCAIRSNHEMLSTLMEERCILIKKAKSESGTEGLKIFLEQRKDVLLARIKELEQVRQLENSLNTSFQA